MWAGAEPIVPTSPSAELRGIRDAWRGSPRAGAVARLARRPAPCGPDRCARARRRARPQEPRQCRGSVFVGHPAPARRSLHGRALGLRLRHTAPAARALRSRVRPRCRCGPSGGDCVDRRSAKQRSLRSSSRSARAPGAAPGIPSSSFFCSGRPIDSSRPARGRPPMKREPRLKYRRPWPARSPGIG